MRSVKTYIRLWFSSDGESPSVVGDLLSNIGFQPSRGIYDYVYYWRKRPSLDEVLELARQVQLTLRGSNVYYRVETVGLDDKPKEKSRQQG